MTVVSVSVERHDSRPYRGGVAVVKVDGRVIAKLRSGETAEVHTREEITTHVDQPLDLKDTCLGCGKTQEQCLSDCGARQAGGWER